MIDFAGYNWAERRAQTHWRWRDAFARKINSWRRISSMWTNALNLVRNGANDLVRLDQNPVI